MMEVKMRKVANWIGILFLVAFVMVMISSLLKKGIWNDQMGMNVLVVGDDSVGLLVLRPKEGLGSWVYLPNDLKVKIFKSQAKYPIISVWKFGEGERNAYEITKKSIGDEMGVAIPRLVKVGGEASVEGVLGMLLSVSGKTDLSVMDRIALRKYLAEIVGSKRLLELSIPQQVFSSIEEPDGKIFKEFTQVMDAWAKDKFLFDSVLAENGELVINNLSGLSGVGLTLSRQAETAGMRVVEVKNDKDDVVSGRGCVFVSPGSFVKSIEFLTNHIECKRLDGEGDSGGEIKVWLL